MTVRYVCEQYFYKTVKWELDLNMGIMYLFRGSCNRNMVRNIIIVHISRISIIYLRYIYIMYKRKVTDASWE